MIDQGVAFHWTTLARRAQVSVKFINDPKHADLKEHVKQKLAAAYDQQAAQAVAASNQTAAQLRVKVANQAAQLRRQDHIIRILERKLGEQSPVEPLSTLLNATAQVTDDFARASVSAARALVAA